MIDLHLHLDGSLSAADIIKTAKKYDIKLPTYDEKELEGLISVDMDCKSLNDYLKCFDIPLLVLQKEETIKELVYDLATRLYEEGLCYAEIRFAPQLSTKEGLSQKEVVLAAIFGLKNALDDIKNKGGFFKAKLILCCMRGEGEENKKANLETVKVFSELKGDYLGGIDLAGAEALFKTENFSYIFEKAKENGIPFTIHAGEADGAESIKKALEFGAKRIGHGVRAIEDSELLSYMIKNNIVFEMCPISNVQTKAVKTINEHPIKKLLDMGARVCVNTDNKVVSKTDIKKEFKFIEDNLGITKEDKKKLLENSVYGAFLADNEKNEILEYMKGKGEL